MARGREALTRDPLPPTRGASVPFVGRHREVAVLEELLDQVWSGVGGVVVVEGEGGIGKSRLLSEALRTARTRGLQVLWGSAEEVESERPFHPLVEAMGLDPGSGDPERAEIGRLIAGDDAAPTRAWLAPDLRLRIVDAMTSLVERLAATGLVLAVEDLHWADSSTLRALRSIARAVRQLPVGLVVTLRPFPSSPELLGATEDFLSAGGRHLRLGPVEEADVAALAGAVAGAPPGPRLRRQMAWAGGNPLFVIELVEAHRDAGVLAVDDVRAEIAEVSLPSTLRLTLLRRLGVLPGPSLEVLRVASVLGRRFSLAQLSAVTGQSPVALLDDLGHALQAGLLSDAGDELAFRHQLIREAIYRDLPLALRRGLHREVARSLGAAGAPIGLVAEHLFLGAVPGDGEALSWLVQAGRQVAPRAPSTAVRLLERALELTGPGDEADRIASELAPLLLQVGRSGDAEALTRHVLAGGPSGSTEVALRRSLGEVLWTRGWLEPAVRELEVAAQITGVPEAERLAPGALAANLKLFLGQPQAAETQARRARAEAERLGDDFARCLALQTLSVAEHARGQLAEALALAQAAVEVATGSVDLRVAHLHPHLQLALVLFEADRLDDAEVRLQEGRRRAEERGALPWLPLYHCFLAMRRLWVGEWDDGVADAEVGLGLADEIGTRLYVPFLHGIAALVAVHRGQLPNARARLDLAIGEFLAAASQSWRVEAETTGSVRAAGPQWPLEWGLWVQALLDEASGDASRALQGLEDAWAVSAPLRFFLGYRFFAPDLVRLAVAAGRRELAAGVTEEVEEGARRSGAVGAAAAALRCRGLLEGDPEALLAAAQAYRHSPRVAELAFSLEEAGVVLQGLGRVDESIPPLEEAVRLYQSFGATRALARVDAALRAVGVRHRRGGRRSVPTGWESLTGTELVVARLTAEGLTNRQIGERLFVSARTVQTHLAHVFAKLGISTRSQLAAEVARRG